MSGIAEILLSLGHRVSGSDLCESETTRRLAALGARVFYGHDPVHVPPDTDVVVLSSAVHFSNPEVVEARRRKISVLGRGEMLGELMRVKFGVAVAGSHGKTTTTSLLGAILARGGLDPTLVIGGKVRAWQSNARLGQGDLLVAEADESDGSFLALSPALALITNIDAEHLDHYGSLENARAAFAAFANRVPFHGTVVLGLDCPNVRAILPQVRKRCVTYGASPDADWVAREIRVRGLVTEFTASYRGQDAGRFVVRLPGRHYAVNALGALAAAAELGVAPAEASAALAEFSGIHRRFEVCGEEAGVVVVSDYAHHPAEIRATIAAAREGFGRRIVAIFQPHRFTRTRDLFREFLECFDEADCLLLTEIYPAGEAPVEGVSGDALYRALQRRGHPDVHYEADRTALVAAALERARPGDMILILGAGNIHEAGAELVATLAARKAREPA